VVVHDVVVPLDRPLRDARLLIASQNERPPHTPHGPSGEHAQVREFLDEDRCTFKTGASCGVLNIAQAVENAGESAARFKHGFESRWGHHVRSRDFYDSPRCWRSGRDGPKTAECPRITPGNGNGRGDGAEGAYSKDCSHLGQ
jgi:hypothetical protein